MFIVVLVQLHRVKKQNPHNVKQGMTVKDVRSVLGITFLLGLTWGFAFFAWGPVNLAFMYLFAIFNSLQGGSTFQDLGIIYTKAVILTSNSNNADFTVNAGFAASF